MKIETKSSSPHGEQVFGEVKLTKQDKRVAKLIKKHLGEKYSRATVYEEYPLELSKKIAKKLSKQKQVEMIEYYDYARDLLRETSGSELLKFVVLDFDLDGKEDTAVVVRRDGAMELVVINEDTLLYQQDFKASYLEPLNYGNYPTYVPLDTDPWEEEAGDDEPHLEVYKVDAPALKLLSIDNDSYILYYDRPLMRWVKILL